MNRTYAPFYWANEKSRTFTSRGYFQPGVTTEQRVREIGDAAERILGIPGFSDKVYDYASRGWISFATPIWVNFGQPKGLPISCFNSHIPDSMEGIAYSVSENMMMSKNGGGTSSFWGKVRSRGSDIKNNGKSEGSVTFMRLFETMIDVSKQGNSRRGIHAPYLPIDHGDIEEFLTIRQDGAPIQNLYPGVCISDDWMLDMIAGDVDKRRIWAKVLQSRAAIGTPYLFFTDAANRGKPDVYQDLGLEIRGSNVCTEIMLPSDDKEDITLQEGESFVCDLSSPNLLHYDEWKDTDLIETITFILDAVMTEFIEKAKNIPFFERAVRFAERHRALGIGCIGHFSYLQSKMWAFASPAAREWNVEVYALIQKQSYAASAKLAEMFGEPELLKGYGRRNSTLMAIAPTTSSAFIIGQASQSIEPPKSNYFVKDLAKIKVTEKNPYLLELLQEKQQNTPEVWDSILKNNGSVQHLDFLSPEEREVFLTFSEINQYEIIQQAADRQVYIDQGQSINLMIHPKTPAKEVNKLYIDAWSLGLKSLYYHHSVNAAQEFRREALVCSNCEG